MSVSNSECQVAFYWEAKRSPVTSAFGCVEISWKTLRNDEFTSAASRGTIPSGFTLRLCCFQCSRVWLGVDSAVLTHVTISRWRWASATFKKKIKKSCNSSENRAAPLTRWHKPPTAREGEALKKTWPVLQIDRGVISVRALPGRVNEAFFFFLYRSCVLTPATPRFDAGSPSRSRLSDTAGSTDVTIIQGLFAGTD